MTTWIECFSEAATSRENEVAALLAMGYSQSTVARELKLSRGRIHAIKNQIACRINAAKRRARFLSLVETKV